MKRSILLMMIFSALSFADEVFEINQKNCNLSIKKIREIIPDESKQLKVFKQCLQKAGAESWIRNKLVKH